MKKFKIYLETSVISSLFSKNKIFVKLTKNFLEKAKSHKLYVSSLVIKELSKSELIKGKINQIYKKYSLKILTLSEKAMKIYEEYKKAKIIPKKFWIDALHIAIPVAFGMDIIVSRNLKHIVNPNTIKKVNEINKKKGFPFIIIATPEEVEKWL